MVTIDELRHLDTLVVPLPVDGALPTAANIDFGRRLAHPEDHRGEDGDGDQPDRGLEHLLLALRKLRAREIEKGSDHKAEHKRSWQMYPLGVLFGLGFDTATEVGLLGISATQTSQGLSIWSIMVFPALFTTGMSLVGTSDSILMLGAYGWAFVKPIRKPYYNLTITAVSVVVAVVVGGIEALGLIDDQLGPGDNGFWGAIGSLNDNCGILGYLIVGIFIFAWLISYLVYRAKRYDEIEMHLKDIVHLTSTSSAH